MSQPDIFQISDEVAAALGTSTANLLALRNFAAPVPCYVCGVTQQVSSRRPVAVLLLRNGGGVHASLRVALDEAGRDNVAAAVEFAHPSCAPSGVYEQAGPGAPLITTRGAAIATRPPRVSGDDARAFFGAFNGQPILLWEPHLQAHGIVDGSAELSNLYIGDLTRTGLALTGTWEPDTLPDAPGWEVRIASGQVAVSAAGRAPDYMQELTDEVLAWAAAAGDRCALLTGTGTGVLTAGGPDESTLRVAGRAGRLVGGWVPIVRGRRR